MFVERPPRLKACSRLRKRGPRSLHAAIKRGTVLDGLRQPRDGGLCKSKPAPSCETSIFTVLCGNLRGFLSNHAELCVHLEMLGMPHFVGLVETWLTNVVGNISLPGYTLVSRRDRQDGRQGGGIVFFARNSVFSQIVHVGDSTDSERSFH